MTQTLTILYFAWLRERTGSSQEQIPFPDEVQTVADLIRTLSARGAGYAAAFEGGRSVRCAVNQVFADPATPVRPGDEVAFFPPVTGG